MQENINLVISVSRIKKALEKVDGSKMTHHAVCLMKLPLHEETIYASGSSQNDVLVELFDKIARKIPCQKK